MVSSSTSDFKTIKAKVGKRAPIKANVTDTSFQAVGLHISKQVGITTSTTTSTSNDQQTPLTVTHSGLSIHQLLIQLKHPTIAVRISALKSLKGICIIPIKNIISHDRNYGHNNNDALQLQQQHRILYPSNRIYQRLLPI
jgi:hypothetical protein